jgi:hypothetical protein
MKKNNKRKDYTEILVTTYFDLEDQCSADNKHFDSKNQNSKEKRAKKLEDQHTTARLYVDTQISSNNNASKSSGLLSKFEDQHTTARLYVGSQISNNTSNKKLDKYVDSNIKISPSNLQEKTSFSSVLLTPNINTLSTDSSTKKIKKMKPSDLRRKEERAKRAKERVSKERENKEDSEGLKLTNSPLPVPSNITTPNNFPPSSLSFNLNNSPSLSPNPNNTLIPTVNSNLNTPSINLSFVDQQIPPTLNPSTCNVSTTSPPLIDNTNNLDNPNLPSTLPIILPLSLSSLPSGLSSSGANYSPSPTNISSTTLPINSPTSSNENIFQGLPNINEVGFENENNHPSNLNSSHHPSNNSNTPETANLSEQNTTTYGVGLYEEEEEDTRNNEMNVEKEEMKDEEEDTRGNNNINQDVTRNSEMNDEKEMNEEEHDTRNSNEMNEDDSIPVNDEINEEEDIQDYSNEDLDEVEITYSFKDFIDEKKDLEDLEDGNIEITTADIKKFLSKSENVFDKQQRIVISPILKGIWFRLKTDVFSDLSEKLAEHKDIFWPSKNEDDCFRNIQVKLQL